MYLIRSLANSEHLLSKLLLLTVVICIYVGIYICQVMRVVTNYIGIMQECQNLSKQAESMQN